MIVYSGTKSQFHRDVMSCDIGHNAYTKKYSEDGAWQHEEIVLKPMNPAYTDIVIPNAEAENFMGVAEVLSVIQTLYK